MILCSIKVGLVYRKNRNFVSILLIIFFCIGFCLAIFAILRISFQDLYERPFSLTLFFYMVVLTTILFYIFDIREIILIPFTIAFMVTLLFFINLEAFDTIRHLFIQTMGLIPIIGFFYLGFQDNDGKSFGMGIHWVLLFISGIFTFVNPILSGIISICGSFFLLIGIFGIFDKILHYERRKKMWIEEQF